MLSYRKGTFSNVPDSLAVFQTFTAKSKRDLRFKENSLKIICEQEVLGNGKKSALVRFFLPTLNFFFLLFLKTNVRLNLPGAIGGETMIWKKL